TSDSILLRGSLRVWTGRVQRNLPRSSGTQVLPVLFPHLCGRSEATNALVCLAAPPTAAAAPKPARGLPQRRGRVALCNHAPDRLWMAPQTTCKGDNHHLQVERLAGLPGTWTLVAGAALCRTLADGGSRCDRPSS